MRRFLISFLVCVFTSCNVQKNIVEIRIEECINSNINDSNLKTAISFYDLVDEFEKELLEEKFLSNVTKDGYLDLFDLILDNTHTKSKLIELLSNIEEKYNFNSFLYKNQFIIFNTCPFYSLVTEKNDINSTLYYQVEILKSIMSTSYNDKDLITELISITENKDFNKITYRAPLIMIVMINVKMLNN